MTQSIRLDPDAQRLYVELLKAPDAGIDELAELTGLSGREVRHQLEVLADLNLVGEAGESGQTQVVSPHLGYGQLVAQAEESLRRQEADLAAARGALARLANEHLVRHQQEAIVHLQSLEAINERLTQLAEIAVTECVSFNPGRRSLESIEASKPLNSAALERGVAIRFVYADAVRNDLESREYGAWLAERGGEARTVPVVPHLMVIVDRAVALLPCDPDDPAGGAIEVRSPGIVTALLSHFEDVWARAHLLGHENDTDAQGLTAQQRELLHLLAHGHTDESAARKLGVSLRTVRRMMSDLMDRLGARSRFEAGLLAHRRGWLRDERP